MEMVLLFQNKKLEENSGHVYTKQHCSLVLPFDNS